MDRYRQIGFSSQRIRYIWLEKTAQMCLAGMSVPDIAREIRSMLSALSSGGSTKRSSREKAVTILMKIWVTPYKELVDFRDAGLKLLSIVPREDRVALHWGMIMAAYPFWASVASEVGRLIRLQTTVAAQQVRRRLIEQYGDRELVVRATRNVVRSFVDWGVLKETSEKGVYTSGFSLAIAHVELIAWLAEAFLHAQPNGSAALRTVLDSTSLFPFRLSPISADRLVAASNRIDVLRHGLDQDMIMLRAAAQPAVKRGGS